MKIVATFWSNENKGDPTAARLSGDKQCYYNPFFGTPEKKVEMKTKKNDDFQP